jgi:hypothetical protein
MHTVLVDQQSNNWESVAEIGFIVKRNWHKRGDQGNYTGNASGKNKKAGDQSSPAL